MENIPLIDIGINNDSDPSERFKAINKLRREDEPKWRAYMKQQKERNNTESLKKRQDVRYDSVKKYIRSKVKEQKFDILKSKVGIASGLALSAINVGASAAKARRRNINNKLAAKIIAATGVLGGAATVAGFNSMNKEAAQTRDPADRYLSRTVNVVDRYKNKALKMKSLYLASTALATASGFLVPKMTSLFTKKNANKEAVKKLLLGLGIGAGGASGAIALNKALEKKASDVKLIANQFKEEFLRQQKKNPKIYSTYNELSNKIKNQPSSTAKPTVGAAPVAGDTVGGAKKSSIKRASKIFVRKAGSTLDKIKALKTYLKVLAGVSAVSTTGFGILGTKALSRKMSNNSIMKRNSQRIKGALIGAAITGTAGAGYIGYKNHDKHKEAV